MKKRRKFLVPLDGSERALRVCRHIAALTPLRGMQAVLLHVFSRYPDAHDDLPPGVLKRPGILPRSWRSDQLRQVQDYMQLAKRLLVSGGFPESAVEIRIQKRVNGISRDILREARDDYEFVVIRRRGMGVLAGMIIGSLTLKVLQGLTFTPLIIAGRKALGNRLLIGFDGSPGAMHALKFAGRLVGPYPEFKICLMHVLRSGSAARPGLHRALISEEQLAPVRETIMRRIETARSQLVAIGITPERVTTRFLSGAVSRAAEIAKYAEAENYGIIVLGRRGVSRVRDFFIGRVTNKVVHLARDRSVCIAH
jgi:nucleotide-binding universal stress UspA family protein